MKIITYCIFWFASSILFSFAESMSDKKLIDNFLYSIIVPSHWEAAPGMIGDGTVPPKRDMGVYTLYHFMWQTPIRDREDGPKAIGVFIESYQRKDGISVTIDEIKDIEIRKVASLLNLEVLSVSKNQEIFTFTKISKELDGSVATYREICLLHKNKDMVHCVNVSLREEHYQAENQKMIYEILESFTVK